MKPKPKDRLQRCMGIIENADKAFLLRDEQSLIRTALYNLELGKPSETKEAAAILECLNEHIL